MDATLMNRLTVAVERLLEKNRRLEAECSALRTEHSHLQQERQQLLADVETVLKRLEDLPLEDS